MSQAMNEPFSTMGKPEPQIVVFTPAMRRLVCDAIESLILLLDEIDGDVDAETTILRKDQATGAITTYVQAPVVPPIGSSSMVREFITSASLYDAVFARSCAESNDFANS